MWEYINYKVKTREGVSNLNIDPSDPNSRLTTSDKEKAGVLGQFFSSVFTLEPPGNIPHIEAAALNDVMENLVITEQTVKQKLDNLNVNKSVGPDGIHPRFLRELSNELCVPLAILYNMSLEKGELPTEWKKGRISAIFKKGSRKKAGNYRPVSLTSIVCKCMEHCIRDHIDGHMRRNNLYSSQQYGFIKGRSTVLQLLQVMNAWTETLDSGYPIDTVCIPRLHESL